jgi:hypothetical protein
VFLSEQESWNNVQYSVPPRTGRLEQHTVYCSSQNRKAGTAHSIVFLPEQENWNNVQYSVPPRTGRLEQHIV